MIKEEQVSYKYQSLKVAFKVQELSIQISIHQNQQIN